MFLRRGFSVPYWFARIAVAFAWSVAAGRPGRAVILIAMLMNWGQLGGPSISWGSDRKAHFNSGFYISIFPWHSQPVIAFEARGAISRFHLLSFWRGCKAIDRYVRDS